MLLPPPIGSQANNIRLRAPGFSIHLPRLRDEYIGGAQPIASDILCALWWQMEGEKSDKSGGIEELQVFFEVVVVGGVKENFAVEALETHFFKRDWRGYGRPACQVLRKILPLLRASARQQDGCV